MKIYFCLLLFVTLFSCKKSNNEPVSELSFNADGVIHSYSGDWNFINFTGCSIDDLFTNSLGYFILTGVLTQSDEGFDARVHAPTVEAKTYTNVEFECYLNGLHYPISSDCLVSISKIEKGRGSGTFSGKIAKSPSSATVNITNGIFKNVLIRK